MPLRVDLPLGFFSSVATTRSRPVTSATSCCFLSHRFGACISRCPDAGRPRSQPLRPGTSVLALRAARRGVCLKMNSLKTRPECVNSVIAEARYCAGHQQEMNAFLSFSQANGRSPRVWGRCHSVINTKKNIRTIPTQVGRTTLALILFQRAADHPHACGETLDLKVLSLWNKVKPDTQIHVVVVSSSHFSATIHSPLTSMARTSVMECPCTSTSRKRCANMKQVISVRARCQTRRTATYSHRSSNCHNRSGACPVMTVECRASPRYGGYRTGACPSRYWCRLQN